MPTKTENLLQVIPPVSASIPSARDQILENFKNNKEYRHAFVEESVRTSLAIQIKAIREQRQMKRPEFAALMSKAPSWVFRLEDPNQAPPTISTLLQVAEAFDVNLEIRFGSFSNLLDRLDRLCPDSFEVPSFSDELRAGDFNRTQRKPAGSLGTTTILAADAVTYYAVPQGADALLGTMSTSWHPKPQVIPFAGARPKRNAVEMAI